MLRRVTVQCVIFLSFPAVAEARKTRAAMINCDDAAVKASAAQLAQTAPSPPKRVTAASHPAPVLPQAPLQLMAQQPVRQQPAQPIQTAAPPGPGRAEMPTAREQMMQLGVGINGIHGALRLLPRPQTASGFNLRSGFADARPVDSNTKDASDAPKEGGLDSAQLFSKRPSGRSIFRRGR